MFIFNRVPQNLIAAALIVMTAHCWGVSPSLAQTQPISILLVRHAEADGSQPTIPLTAAGRQRADLLAYTLRGVKFTHIFTTHTTRTRQMVEAIAAAQGVPIVQLPVPGSMLDGQPVTDQTSRRVPIEPIATALLQLSPGSVALVALNSENIFAILHRLGVPVAPAGQSCALGSLCVPCTDNSCYPRGEFDHLWHLVREADRPEPLALVELRYGGGWRDPEH
jgi:histidine phosphatase superfamily protein (branch 1)